LVRERGMVQTSTSNVTSQQLCKIRKRPRAVADRVEGMRH
jgi:hypothetical protein